MGRLRRGYGGRTRNPEARWWAWAVPGYGMSGWGDGRTVDEILGLAVRARGDSPHPQAA